MIYTLFTDPHIDKTPVANTTAKSRKRWKQFLFDNTMTAAGGITALADGAVCVGDLFDRTQVDARDVAKGARIAGKCLKVLGGNHDVENSLDSYSALNLVSEFCDDIVVLPVFNKVVVHTDVSLPGLVFIPHHTSKKLFAEALDRAAAIAKKTDSTGRYLFLHCNYNCDMATKETELNLTRDDADVLLKAGFQRIFIGHDHNRKTDFDGRLVVLGSVNPTSFGDCESEHGCYTLNAGTDELEYTCLWNPRSRMLKLTAQEMMAVTAEDLLRDNLEVDFIRVVGDVAPSEAVEFSRSLKRLWKAADEAERLFAIKVDAKIRAVALRGEAVMGETGTLNLKAQIVNELADSPELLALWKEILEELK